MNTKINIVVLFGGRSGEHEVSLMSARSVLNVLSQEKYEIIPVGITKNGIWVTGEHLIDAMMDGNTKDLTPVTIIPQPGENSLYAIRKQKLEFLAKIDVVFPVLHGTFGEDGTLQGLLEMADLAYVGAGVLGSSLGMDKGVFKQVMRAYGIPVLDSMVCTRNMIKNHAAMLLILAEKVAPYPLFIKPANLGSSVGITKCQNRSDLIEGLLEAARYDRRVLIERGLQKPREIEVSVLGNDDPIASVPGEIKPSDEFYSYCAKYIDDRSELIIPAPLMPEVSKKVRELATTAYRAVDCAGMARVDFLFDASDGSIYLSEINTIPGFTQISMYPKLWEASGLTYSALVDKLVELALERKRERDNTERNYGRQA